MILESYQSYLIREELDRSEMADLKKVLTEKLRTVVDYTKSSETYTLKGLKLIDENILQNILKEIGWKATNYKVVRTSMTGGDTEFKIEKI
jgi:hypothetical protein